MAESPTPEEAILMMQQGSTMLKCGRSGSPHFRFFILSEDLETLRWASPKKKSDQSSVVLSIIKEIRLGQKTLVFQRNPLPEYEQFSFSLIYDDRTLDIICKDKLEFNTWITGLKTLTIDPQGSRPAAQVPPGMIRAATENERLSISFRGGQTIVSKREDSNDVYTWGHGVNGRLGHGDEDDQFDPRVVQSLLGKEIRAVSCGPSHTAALNASGGVSTWGAGSFGRLGHGQERHRFTPTIITKLQGIRIVRVACGDFHTGALAEDGKLFMWGKGDDGRLGHGDTTMVTSPKVVEALADEFILDLDCGYVSSTAITNRGGVFTWGGNEKGQLGHGDKENRLVPTAVKSLAKYHVTQVSCATWHTAAITQNGLVFTWGNGANGKLGHSDEEDQLKPKQIEGLEFKITQISCGDFHTAILDEKGVIYTWGEGNYGQLGHGTAISQHSKPLPISNGLQGKKMIQVACGANHTAALTEKGQLFSWGCAVNGRLGHGDEKDQWSPKVVFSMMEKRVRQIACGGSHSAATVVHGWIPDEESDRCMACKRIFTFVNRRHHCRNCGGIFCGACSTKRFPLLKDGFTKPVRVCDRCHGNLSKETQL